MHLPKFEHLRPSSLQEASRLLKEHSLHARLVAGGTDLYPRMKYGVSSADIIISMKGLPVNDPALTPAGDLRIDALMTLADLARSPLVLDRAPLLVEAALNVGSNQIRHMGTLGGNLCLETRCTYYNQSHMFQFVDPCLKRKGDQCYLIPKGKKCRAVFMADTVPALICMQAGVEIKTAGNSRKIPVEKLYTGNSLRPLALLDNEIVSEVLIPSPPPMRGTAFAKFSLRGGLEFGALTCAVLLDMEDDGKTCASARITVGSVAAAPLRATKAESALTGERLSDKFLTEVARLVAEEIHPVMHHGYSVAFLRECIKVQASRSLGVAAKRVRPECLNS